MQKVHDPSKNSKWVDYPDIESPIIADELNRHEIELDTIDSRVVVHETTKANQVDLLTCVASITLNKTTGILTITLKNGSSTTIDTGLSKLAVNFDYDADPTSPHYEQLILEMADGTYKYIDLSALITQFEFVNSATITWTIGNDGTVTANIINGSITEAMLETNFLANCRLEVSKALGFSQDAEAWAKGTKGGTPVASTDERYHNNSKYYAEQSQASSEDSEAWAVGERNGVPVESTDETYENNAKYWATQASGFPILSYGISTWDDFLDAYTRNRLVYCRASSNANPATGNQTRLAFMAYVSNPTNPTQVEFQYYRSVNSHTDAQQGDQVFVYTLTSSGTWSVTVRDTFSKVNVDYGLSKTYSNGAITLGLDTPLESFAVTASNWTANSDSATSGDYPYVYSVTTDKYTADSTPVWDLAGAGAVPTSTERTSIDMILEAVFSTSGIALYATDEPTSDLTLRVKGK